MKVDAFVAMDASLLALAPFDPIAHLRFFMSRAGVEEDMQSDFGWRFAVELSLLLSSISLDSRPRALQEFPLSGWFGFR